MVRKCIATLVCSVPLGSLGFDLSVPRVLRPRSPFCAFGAPHWPRNRGPGCQRVSNEDSLKVKTQRKSKEEGIWFRK